MKAWWPLIVFLALGVAFAIGLTKDPARLPSELIDKPFPEFALSSLHDEVKTLTQEDLRGHITVVNVFGSWCVACEVEHPKLLEIQDQVRLWGVDWRDNRAKAKVWLERRGDPYAEIIFDPDSVLAIDLGITGAPESYIVDRDGRVRYKFTGIITDTVWRDNFVPIIAELEAQNDGA